MYKDRGKYLAAHKRYNEKHRLERRLLAQKWRKKNKAKKKEYDKLYMRKYYHNPLYQIKDKARKLLRKYVKDGKIPKGKCFCGNSIVQAHHEDYSKPLDVIWLCKKHHEAIHHPLP